MPGSVLSRRVGLVVSDLPGTRHRVQLVRGPGDICDLHAAVLGAVGGTIEELEKDIFERSTTCPDVNH